MSQSCCNNKEPTVFSRVRQSVLCGVYGSLVFSVSAMSYLQASIFLKVCGKYLSKRAYESHMRNRAAAKQNMKRGFIPAVEMFVIMPVMFYALHCVLSMPWIYCLMACWATMFAICMAVRLAGIVKNCPDFGRPIYSRGYPFAMMKDESGNLHDGDDNFEHSTAPAMHIPKLTAYLLGFAFLGFRLLSAVSYVLLCCLELACIPFTFAAESSRKLHSLVKDGSVSAGYIGESYAAGLIGLSERLERANTLIKAATLDLSWVMSFGISGATHIKDATLFWDVDWDFVEQEERHHRGTSERKNDKNRRGGGSCCHKVVKEGAASGSKAANVSPSQPPRPDGSQNVLEDVFVSQSISPRCHSSGAY